MKNFIIILLVTCTTLQLQANETNDLPYPVVYTVLDHGAEEEIIYTEKYDEEGTTIYEVRLHKRKYLLILLIDKDGNILESIKETYFD